MCTMYGSEQSFDHDHVIGIFSMFTTGHLDFVKGFIDYWVEFIHLTVHTLFVSCSEYSRDKPFLLIIVTYLKK